MTEVSISAGRGPGYRAGLLDHPRALCVRHCGEGNKTLRLRTAPPATGNQFYGGVCMFEKRGQVLEFIALDYRGGRGKR
jgi:hypothetical protein